MITPAFLDRRTLASTLPATMAVHLFETLDSTNTEAKRRASEENGPALYIARTQTGGRGRLGRSFHSPATGLYMTLAYTTSRPLDEAARVTAAAAVAAATAIDTLTGRSPSIKWVNDLYLGGGKLAGILTEAVTLPALPDGRPRSRMVVGIGINLTTADFPDGLRAPAAALFSPDEAGCATPTFVAQLAGEISCRLLDSVENSEPRVAAYQLQEYRARLLYVGERVICTYGREELEGVILGVDDDYSLLVHVGGRVVALSSGEISVRPVKR